MVMIAKGKTAQVEYSQLGGTESHTAAHSQSGWVTISGFREYLTMLKKAFRGVEPIYLILDCYAVHRSPEVRDCTLSLGVLMRFTPGDMADSLQPLPCAVFGTLKAAARRLFRMHTTD
jgi:hypothetical protein